MSPGKKCVSIKVFFLISQTYYKTIHHKQSYSMYSVDINYKKRTLKLDKSLF